ncbi:MAG: hypothetical protein IRZ21_03140 [Thermoleophilaceae bacterium]|nr:hypothetical protein [Thermoleophilaceae bacterium]
MEVEEIVRTVTLELRPDTPEKAPPAEFDAALEHSNWPDAPRSQAVRRRFGMGWYELLEILFDPERDLQYNVSQRKRRKPRARPTREEIAYALRLMAELLEVATLKPDQHDAGRAQLQLIAGARWQHGDDRAYLLPTSTEIQVALDPAKHAGWDLALKLAGLAPRPQTAGLAGLPLDEAFEGFLQDVGLPPLVAGSIRRVG